MSILKEVRPAKVALRSPKVAGLLRRSDELTAAIDLVVSDERYKAAVDRLMDTIGEQSINYGSNDERTCERDTLMWRTLESGNRWLGFSSSPAAPFGCGRRSCDCQPLFQIVSPPTLRDSEWDAERAATHRASMGVDTWSLGRYHPWLDCYFSPDPTEIGNIGND